MRSLQLALCLSVSSLAFGASECPPLKDRLSVTDVDVETPVSWSGGLDNPSSFWDGQSIRQIVMAPEPDGEMKIAWNARDGVRVTALDADLKRKGADLKLGGGNLRDFVAHPEGGAVLRQNGGRMALTRFDEAGKTIFHNTGLTGTVSNGIHQGSLSYNGRVYGAYFAVHRGGHEGDALSLIDTAGRVVRQVWGWGCSHSIDMRLILNGPEMFPLCLTEAYPGHGLYLNNRTQLVSIPGGGGGRTNGRIGGMVTIGENLVVAYSRAAGGGYQAGVTVVKKNAPHVKVLHGAIPERGAHRNVKIGRIGTEHFVVSLENLSTRNTSFRVFDANGKMVEGPVTLPVRSYPRSDYKTLPNGDLVFASVWGDARKLKVTRLKACPVK